MKSPSLGGMFAGFYKRHWDIVGGDLVQFVQEFFIIGIMLPKINETMVIFT